MKIRGWTITTLVTYGEKTFPDVKVEYGNSPIRDRKSRLEYIAELVAQGKDFIVEPITQEQIDAILAPHRRVEV